MGQLLIQAPWFDSIEVLSLQKGTWGRGCPAQPVSRSSDANLKLVHLVCLPRLPWNYGIAINPQCIASDLTIIAVTTLLLLDQLAA